MWGSASGSVVLPAPWVATGPSAAKSSLFSKEAGRGVASTPPYQGCEREEWVCLAHSGCWYLGQGMDPARFLTSPLSLPS